MSIAASPLAGAALGDSERAEATKTSGPKPRLMVALADPKIIPERR